MGSDLVIAPSPSLDFAPGIADRQEPVYVQKFLAQPPVEGLDLRVIRRFPGAREILLDTVLLGPSIHGLRYELRAVIHFDRTGPATACGDALLLKPTTMDELARVFDRLLRIS